MTATRADASDATMSAISVTADSATACTPTASRSGRAFLAATLVAVGRRGVGMLTLGGLAADLDDLVDAVGDPQHRDVVGADVPAAQQLLAQPVDEPAPEVLTHQADGEETNL